MAAKKATGKNPVNSKQAMAVANFLKKGGAKKAVPAKAAPDAEDAIDGGADEATEE